MLSQNGVLVCPTSTSIPGNMYYNGNRWLFSRYSTTFGNFEFGASACAIPPNIALFNSKAHVRFLGFKFAPLLNEVDCFNLVMGDLDETTNLIMEVIDRRQRHHG
jgi:hypothetical protein